MDIQDKYTEKLKDFETLRILGSGTFGRVQLVRHKQNTCYYAMKVLRKSEIIRLKQVEHVHNERNILSSTKHPFIVNLFTSFQDDHNLYIVLEYIQGGELFSRLRKVGRFNIPTATFYSAQVVLAIEHLHSMNIIYRDLKPENILIDAQGYLKLVDLGFAKKIDDKAWTLCGTPDYLAPEVIYGKGYGKGVDWWALGILIYELLIGYPPFYDDNPFSVYEKILQGKVSYPGLMDAYSKDLVKKLLQADRTKRLGCMKGGVDEIKKHKFYKDIDFDQLRSRSYPQVPYLPTITHAGDSSNFDSCDEEEDTEKKLQTDYGDVFKDF